MINSQSFIGLVVLSAIATLVTLWVMPPFGSFAVSAKVVNTPAPGWTHS
jgi:hypothetical protein